MRTLPSAWSAIIKGNVQRTILVTIDPTGKNPIRRPYHPALDPGAVCVTAERNLLTQGCIEVSSDSRTVPFMPFLMNVPTVTKSLNLLDLRADIATTELSIAGDPSFIRRLGSVVNATVRLDLWSPGIALEDVVPLLAGRVTGDATVDFTNGTAQFSASDGDPRAVALFPPDKITRDDFPDAPQDSIGKVVNVMFYAYQGRVAAIPISRDRKRFLVQAGTWAALPTSVQRGGVEIDPVAYSFVTAQTPSGLTYLELRFDESPDQLVGGANSLITVTGGVGALSQRPIEYLADYSGLPLDRMSKSRLASLGFLADISGTHASPASAFELISRRFAPQLGFAATQELMQTRLVPFQLRKDGPVIRVGSELIFANDAGWAKSPVDSVYNSIEVLCGRDSGSTDNSTPLARVLRNENTASRYRLDQRASTAAFGARHLEFPALDVQVQRKPGSVEVAGSDMGESIADVLAELYAFPYLTMPYTARSDFGVRVERGDCFLLVDEANGLDEVPCIVVETEIGGAAPVVTLAIRQR